MNSSEITYTWSPWLNQTQLPWEKILHLGVKKQFRKDSIIIGNGQLVKDLYYLYKGKIKVVSTTCIGREKPIWYISKGNIFGEVPFLDGGLCYTVFTCQEDCTVYTFSRKVFSDKIVLQHPEILMSILTSLSLKTRNLLSQINDLCLNSPKMRVCKMLYYLSLSHRGNIIEISQQELGDMLAIHRITLNHIINDLKDKGIISKKRVKKKIIIEDPKQLLEEIDVEMNKQ